jgi:hypothetical protein
MSTTEAATTLLPEDDKRAFYRERYIKRCQDPAYRAKLAAQALARYYARKIKDAEEGVKPAKPQGRPRKYLTEPTSNKN